MNAGVLSDANLTLDEKLKLIDEMVAKAEAVVKKVSTAGIPEEDIANAFTCQGGCQQLFTNEQRSTEQNKHEHNEPKQCYIYVSLFIHRLTRLYNSLSLLLFVRFVTLANVLPFPQQ